MLENQELFEDDFSDILKSPLKWIQTFVKDYKTGKPLEPNIAQTWVLNSNHRFNVLRMHRRSGKCALAGDRLYLADGTRTTYGEQVNKEFNLLTLVDKKIKSVSAFATYNDFESVYEIELASGQKIIRNAAHPLYKAELESIHQSKPKITSHGWTPVSELKPGDLLAVPQKLEFDLPGLDISDEEIKLIAYLIGDGCVTQPSMVGFSQNPGLQLEEMKSICTTLGARMTQISSCDWKIYGREPRKNPILDINRKWGLQGQNSHTKKVPEQFFNLTLDQLQVFLSRLYSTDGWASSNCKGTRGSGQIGYSSVSRELIDDIQHLLLRFGVHARIDKKKTSYTLIIDNFEDVIRFVEQIGIYGKEKACDLIYQKSQSLWGNKYGKAESLTWEEGTLYKRYDAPGVTRIGNPRIMRRKIDVTPWRLKNAPPCMQWEKIKSVCLLEEKQHTIGISVPEHHTYLTDFYEHNTFACLLLCLYYCFTRKNANIIFIGPGMAQVSAFFDELDKFLESHPWMSEGLKKSKKPYVRTFPNGTVLRGFTTGSSSQGKGNSLRGQGADIVFIDEVALMQDEDFAAITPILIGNKYYPVSPITIATSTPGAAHGKFYEWCTSKDSQFKEFKLSIEDNPMFSDEERRMIEKTCSIAEWKVEYLVEFLNTEATVFSRDLVEKAQKVYDYAITPKPWPEIDRNNPNSQKLVQKVWRTMGVDWDKHNRDGSGPNLVVLEVDERDGYSGIPRVIYRKSIPQEEYSLLNAVKEIITLHDRMRLDRIYVDRGYGEMQLEYLKDYGRRNPETGLDKIVKGFAFKQNIPVQDSFGVMDQKPFKGFMVNLLVKCFEEGTIEFSKSDRDFFEQLIEYRIVHESASTVSYSTKKEHIIDACGLAAVAMFQIHTSPFRRFEAARPYFMEGPQSVPSSSLSDSDRRSLPPGAQMILGVKRDRTEDKIYNTKVEYDNLPALNSEREARIAGMFPQRTGSAIRPRSTTIYGRMGFTPRSKF